MRRLIATVVIVALLVPVVPGRIHADDSDIFGSNIQPNVMIIIDDSGSMADGVPSNAYVASNTYVTVALCDRTKVNKQWVYSDCVSTKVYQSGSSGSYTTYATSVGAVNSSSAQAALTSSGFWTGTIGGSTVTLLLGNYVNYLNDTCSQGGACSTPKMTVAQRVVNSLLANVNGVRFGVMTFYYGSNGVRGARVLAPIGSSVTTMQNAVNALSPTSDTPLGDALYDAGRYFRGATLTNGTSFSSPITLGCQPNFVILVTDGMQTAGTRYITPPVINGTLQAPNSTNHVAQDLYTSDFSSTFAGTQNIIVDTVGFGISISADVVTTAEALRSLQVAAQSAGGQFYQADSEAQLAASLQDAIRRVVQATFTFATPVLPTTSTTGSSKAYLAAFKSDASRPFWQGYLKAYQRDSTGLVPVDANGVPLDSAMVWEAGRQLSTLSPSTRRIFTVVPPVNGGSRVESFAKSNSNITATTLNVGTSTLRDQVIDFVRGTDSFDADFNGNTTEDRPWKLGDIFHSTPVLVTPPVLALNDSSYITFKQNQAGRGTVLIAGSNDGMLHAFNESDGSESWAFVPPDLLDNLQTLTANTGEHGYFVDSSPIAMDIKVSGSWKTIVVFGLRRGGTSYYALDITDTSTPVWMWSYTDSKMGETWSEPAVGKVKIGGNDKYVMFVGGGYNTPNNNNTGKAFFAIDLATGARLWQYYNDGTLDDRRYMNFSVPSNATAVDLNGDGYVDRVYVGDVGGQMWKFDVSDGATSNWKGKRLFIADTSAANPPASGEYYPTQPFYGAPALAYDANYKLWVYFGTGDRNHPDNTSSNRFYGIKDTTGMDQGTALRESDLADVTSANGTATYGWLVRLGDSEKVLAAANVFNMNVLFSTFTPSSTASCEGGGGSAKLYSVQLTTGYASMNFSTGAALTSTDATATRSKSVGEGIAAMPVVLMTPPVNPGTAGASGSSSVITATSNQQLQGTPVPAPTFMKTLRSWREQIR